MNSMSPVCRTATAVMCAMLVVGVLALPAMAQLQQHGAGITKSCTKLLRCTGHCAANSATPCISDANCGASDTCVLGNVCQAPADCAGLQKFCIGEVTAPGVPPHAC